MSFKKITLGELCDIGSSKRIKMADYKKNGIPFFRSKEVIELSKGNQISTELFIAQDQYDLIDSKFGSPAEGDILLTSVGTLGVPYQVEKKELPFYFKDGNLTWLKAFKKDVNPRWIYYWLTSPVGQRKIDEISIGSTQKAITIVGLKSLEIEIPQYIEQCKTVDILNSLNSKIQTNRQINQTLEDMAQALFKSWFVDFEPVKAKIAAKERWHAMQPVGEFASPACSAAQPEPLPALEEYMNLAAMQAISGKTAKQLQTLKTQNPEQYQQLHQTAQLFPIVMQDSELGEIPERWEISEIGNEVEVIGGGTPATKNSEYWEGGNINWATPKDLSSLSDKILTDTERKITESGLAKISSGLLPENTVLMSSRAPVGYLALAKIPVAINQGFIAMKCHKTLTPEYVIQWCVANMDDIHQRASGTTFQEISKKSFKPMVVIVPAQDILQIYSTKVFNLYKQIELNVRECKNLESIRDSLLPKLLSGNYDL